MQLVANRFSFSALPLTATLLSLAWLTTEDSSSARSFRWSSFRWPLARPSTASGPSGSGEQPVPAPHSEEKG